MLSVDSQIPVIDISNLVNQTQTESVAEQIGSACRVAGFFYIVGHGVDVQLQNRLLQVSRDFFAQDLDQKLKIRMELGGRAWRGYFPVGDELTSGKPDIKEGIYFGSELPEDHPRVRAGTPLHGRNLFPDTPLFRETVLEYMDAMTRLGHTLMEGMALSLGIDRNYFRDSLTDDPTILFRIFHYPASESVAGGDASWGVGEHTDYGLLTILRQDEIGGLQVKSKSRWIDAPPIANSFVCNIGDMLDRMSGGRYRSTPHRVRNRSDRGRLSFPFFFDPGFDAEVKSIFEDDQIEDDRELRWDGNSVHELSGTYGEYLLQKVSKVFPALRQRQL